MKQKHIPILTVKFYKTSNDSEPVREWLQSLSMERKKKIGEDIKTVQFGWPLGMPVVRKIDKSLWEVRTRLRDGIARVLFTVVSNNTIVLLHGFIKKSQKISQEDLKTAKNRLNNF